MDVRAATACILILLLSAGCYQSSRPGDDAGRNGADGGEGLPDGASWPEADLWWPDAEPADVGPVCPNNVETIESFECDLFLQDCGPGEGCYGRIEYTEDPCVREIYITECFETGLGGQGDACHAWCQRGYECFVTGQGTQCLQVCDILGGERICPPGFICQPTDLPGVGACS